MGFGSTYALSPLYAKTDEPVGVVIVVFVDDVMITVNYANGIAVAANQIKENVKTRVDEDTFKFLAIIIEDVENGILVHTRRSV